MEIKTSKIINVILSIVVLALLVLTGQMTWQQFGEKGAEKISTITDDKSTTTTIAEDQISIAGGVQTFTSEDLGIRFKVLQKSDQGNGNISIHRWGNRVLVSPAAFGASTGQSIQVYQKGANEDLIAAVNRQFLNGYSSTDCSAAITGSPTTSTKLGATFQIVQIQLPAQLRGDPEQMESAMEKCPDRFTTTNGVAYFITDSKHPTQFAFFDIGQYPINADKDTMWQDTLEFLK